MKKVLLSLTLIVSLVYIAKGQSEKCGTVDRLEALIAQNPMLQYILDSIELETQQWIQQRRIFTGYYDASSSNSSTIKKKMTAPYLCPYDNALYQTWPAPTVVGDSVTDSCFWGGDYARVTGMVAGNTYAIYTCGSSAFDSEISVYESGGADSAAYNDDYCGSQSAIKFTPLSSGDYDILVDAYGCDTNSTCIDLSVMLIATPRSVITIPTVVHIVYNVDSLQQNVSDAQVQSQMVILNEDFRRLNSDVYWNAPPVFRGVSNDPLIEFCLAQRDPDGYPTNGITRTATTHSSFSGSSSDDIHYDSLGGKDIWDPDSYMNIWVMDNGGAGGWALLPGAPPDIDGTGLHYTSFGNIGTAAPPFPGGRTAVHEAAHWLNLEHIWGDSICGDDLVDDTPQQMDENSGCPSFPHNPFNCAGTGAGGEMFMNFMDYIDDDCYAMFTYGQTERMDAALFGVRSSLQTSRGCLACATITASFTSSNTTICEGETVSFTSTSTGASTYEWWEEQGGGTLFGSAANASRTFNTAGTYTISLFSMDQYQECEDSAGTTITVYVCTGVDEILSENNIWIYPNPNNGEFTLGMNIGKSQMIQIEVTDMLGKSVYIEEINKLQGIHKKRIDLSQLADGIYTAKISNNQGAVIKKIILNK